MNTFITSGSSTNPLETLVIQQLANLLQDEERLATSYPVLSAETAGPEVREAFSSSLAELRRRAERLQRYVDALDSFGFASSPATAFAS